MPDWKATLNLPRTDFPMKADLQQAEPKAIERWDTMDLYGELRRRRAGAPVYILHDGPPYANGHIHIGHALNKILKDVVVRSRSMAGMNAPYVPGWDCHGLPIELKVDRELGPKKREMSTADFRRACRRYAEDFVEIQREEFKRLAVMGDWSSPYLTMSYAYQATIVRALGRFVAADMVYRGKKPVHWCIHCRTALAEAEVEYEPHASPSIHVEFPLADDSHRELYARIPELEGRSVSTLIWTTTPWTIPSNLAIAFHPRFSYGAYPADGKVVIVAEDLVDQVRQATGRALGEPLARFNGDLLEGLRFRHPLYERDSLAVLADYVTLEQGTGVVHTAPGHGADDFNTGVQYGLETYAPVGPAGHFTDDVAMFAGLRVFDANPKVEEALAARGYLWRRDVIEHHYPHCWRCQHPVIFLATSQWFIAMDTAHLRDKALAAIRDVRWFPAWGQERIRSMLANRPDWCISRQRSWGVPIPALHCLSCGEAVLDADLTEKAATVFEQHGADAWYERPLDEFLPDGFRCSSCSGHEFEREQDILDVWFDSGSSHEGVLSQRPDLRWPADAYLEGSDQYRGWFHSSLLVALGTRGRPPFRDVITHGFVVDADGRKMSKSLGNVIAPQELIQKSGAEIVRLWSSMVDYREEVRIGPEILARVVEAYRKIRNTLRYLVSNLYDFDPAEDLIRSGDRHDVDRYALSRYAEAAQRIVQSYERYDYQTIFHTLNTLVTVDLSAFYLDVSKDRLYTLGARSRARRSAQTTMYVIADGLARLIAPILPVTADELWRHLPGRHEGSVHLAEFQPDLDELVDRDLTARWLGLIKIREDVNKAIEHARQSKVVGSSLAASVAIHTTDEHTATLLREHLDDLPMLFIVSRVTLDHHQAGDSAEGNASVVETGPLTIRVERAPGVKCERCWRYVSQASQDGGVRGICERCSRALDEAVSHAEP